MALILYIFNKQYITVDNTHQLLYTVYHKGEKKNMHIILNHSSMVPIYEQLMEQIKSEIIQSVLKEGEVLPSVRTLAGELRISLHRRRGDSQWRKTLTKPLTGQWQLA